MSLELQYAIPSNPRANVLYIVNLVVFGILLLNLLAEIYVTMNAYRAEMLNPNGYNLEWFEREPMMVQATCFLGFIFRPFALMYVLIAGIKVIGVQKGVWPLAASFILVIISYTFEYLSRFWYYAL